MTLSPETRHKNAIRELEQAEFHYSIAKDGRDKLNALVKSRTADYDAALQDWSRDKSDEAMNRLTTARSQLNAVKELLQEDVAPYATAEAELERCKHQVLEVEAITKGIELAAALGRQQEYFMADFGELQRHYVELMSKMQHTAKAWDDMHKSQYELARRAGLKPDQFQRRIETWGFEAQPLKRVLVRSPLDDNATLAFRKPVDLPSAVDGSPLAAEGRQAVIKGLFDHYSQQSQLKSAMRPRTARPELTPLEEIKAEERELRRRAAEVAARTRQAEQDAQQLEAEQDKEYGARETYQPTMTRQFLAANAGDDDE